MGLQKLHLTKYTCCTILSKYCFYYIYIPYSLKFLRVKNFMDFVDFGVPTKNLALKFFSYSIIQHSTSVIHKNFIHETIKSTIP